MASPQYAHDGDGVIGSVGVKSGTTEQSFTCAVLPPDPGEGYWSRAAPGAPHTIASWPPSRGRWRRHRPGAGLPGGTASGCRGGTRRWLPLPGEGDPGRPGVRELDHAARWWPVCLGIHKATREAAGKTFGDRVVIELERDEAAREVEVPDELAQALSQDRVARTVYEGLSFTHRREYARWVAEAKRPETKARRVGQSLEMLWAGVKAPRP